MPHLAQDAERTPVVVRMAGGGADKLHTIALGEFHQTAHSDLHVDGRIAGTVARCANAHRPARRRGSTPHTPTHRSPSQSDAPPDSASASRCCPPRGLLPAPSPCLDPHVRSSLASQGSALPAARPPAATPTAVAPHFARRSPSRARCSTGPRHPSPMADLQVLRCSLKDPLKQPRVPQLLRLPRQELQRCSVLGRAPPERHEGRWTTRIAEEDRADSPVVVHLSKRRFAFHRAFLSELRSRVARPHRR